MMNLNFAHGNYRTFYDLRIRGRVGVAIRCDGSECKRGQKIHH